MGAYHKTGRRRTKIWTGKQTDDKACRQPQHDKRHQAKQSVFKKCHLLGFYFGCMMARLPCILPSYAKNRYGYTVLAF